MKYRDLKVGQEVLVVYQRSRWAVQHNQEVKTEWLPITKMGRKYGYINKYHQDLPFCLDTGCSVHDPDGNARQNGHGFDVYLSQEAYEEVLHLQHRRGLLVRKFREVEHQLHRAPLAVVNGLLEWLERWEDDRGLEK